MKIKMLLAILIFHSCIHAQIISKDTIKKPSAIYVDGVPPIADSIIQEIKAYNSARFSYLQDWHPVKKEILISTQLSSTTKCHLVSMPGGMRRQLTFYEEPVNQCLFDPKNGKYIIVLKDNNGDEFHQVYRKDITTGKTYLLSEGGKSYNYNLRWSKKGDKLFYTSFQTGSANSQVFVVNPEEPGSRKVLFTSEGPNWVIQDISADNDRLLLSMPYEGSNVYNSLWIYDVRSKSRTQLLPKKNEPGGFYNAQFTPDGNGIFLLASHDEFSQLAFFNLKNNKLDFLSHFRWGIRTPLLSPDGSKIALTVHEAGNWKPYVYYIASKSFKPIDGVPAGLVAGMKWRNNSQSLGFQLATSYAMSDVYEWDSKTGTTVPWVQNEIGGIDVSLIAAPKLIKWKSFDKLEITGFLYPASKKFKGKRPVIIDIHGGPVMQSLPLFNGNANYYTTELGISVIFPNIRGSSGFGKDFTELDNGIKKEDAVKDIGSLLEWIASQPDLDPERVMVTGGSYGGYMTYRTAIEYNKKIRCAAAGFGASDLLSAKAAVDTMYRSFFKAEYGDPDNPVITDYFNRISPLKNAVKLTAPILIFQGKNDPRVPYTESENMVNAIKRNGGKVWYLLANNEGHGFLKQENEDYLFYATVAFVKQYLLN